MIHDTILERIGKTPLVRADRLAKEYGLQCNLLCKCEYFNAGGSVKDRIAKRMIEQAERDGRLTRGKSVIIEPTSGNTGIGLALQCAVLGYRCIICMPEKMSAEKQTVLQALGAEVIRTPNDADYEDPRSHIQVAKRMVKEIPDAVMLDQYVNENNPAAHYEGTAVEIIEDIRESVASQKCCTSHEESLSSKLFTKLGLTSPNEHIQNEGKKLSDSQPNVCSRDSSKLDGLVDGSIRGAGLPSTANLGAEHLPNGHANGWHSDLSESGAKVTTVHSIEDRLDLLVAGAGTGGSISGLSKRLKEEYGSPQRCASSMRTPDGCRVLGIDPIGSLLALPASLNTLPHGAITAFYAVEGIGYEFIPDVLDRSLIDDWLKMDDERSFAMARQLIRTEGLLIGGSSGAAMAGAIEFLTQTEQGRAIASNPSANVVVIMPDSIRNYITKPWLLNSSA